MEHLNREDTKRSLRVSFCVDDYDEKREKITLQRELRLSSAKIKVYWANCDLMVLDSINHSAREEENFRLFQKINSDWSHAAVNSAKHFLVFSCVHANRFSGELLSTMLGQ